MPALAYVIGAVVFFLVISGIRVINQYERAVKFRLGKYVGVLGPGLNWIIPIVDRIERVDIRVVAHDIPSQEVMSQDNVPLKINGVVFFRVIAANKAVLEIENYAYAISQLSSAALRDMTGKSELDAILAKRDEIGQKIKLLVDKETDKWGIDVTDVKIKDIEMPENMKRAMAHQAEAERDRRAQIILAEAEHQAAVKLAEAGKLLEKVPAAMQLRLYQTLSDIAAEKNSTIILPFPSEISEFFKRK